MAIYNRQLLPPKQAETSQTVQYTVPNTSKIIIDKFTGTNTSSSTVTISVNLITVGDSDGDQNLITKERNIAPKETYSFPELSGHIVDKGGSISTIASVASSITIAISGREIVQ
jgi:hypothetical protein